MQCQEKSLKHLIQSKMLPFGMLRFKDLQIFHKFSLIGGVLLIFNATCIFCTESYHDIQPRASNLSSHVSKVKVKLRLCANHNINLDGKGNSVEIPTYFTGRNHTYVLDKYEIDRDNPFTSCSNGESPTTLVNTVTKEDYDQDFHPDIVYEILRAAPFLYDNGYLSVGDHAALVATYYSPNEFCINKISGEGVATSVEFKTCPFSKNRPILPKCCPLGMILGDFTCKGYKNWEQWDPFYMDRNSLTFLPLAKVHPVFTSPRLPCSAEFYEFWEADNCTHEFHPVTDNTIAFIGAHRTWEFLNTSLGWCIDQKQAEGEHEHMVLFHCIGNETRNDNSSDQARISLVYMISMYIGAFFHFMTTFVYLVTWTKQNIHGRTLCSCTGSLLLMQIFLGTAHLLGRLKNQRKTDLCIANSIGGQYFMIAAFTWLVVVNFDLWRTFRSIRADGSTGWKRFVAFSALGWGFPLLVTTISVILDFTFTCRVSGVPVPEFGEHYCFVSPWAQGLYVYYILGILNPIGWIFAILTLVSLYNFKKDASNLRSNKREADQQNVLLFLKLSVVMGLTWVFEVISWAATKENENHIGWIILDLYNALSAILIFIIFVCKMSTLSLLEQTVPCLKGLTAVFSRFTRESSSDNTQSTGAGPSTHHKRSFDSATPVKYTKEEVGGGERGGAVINDNGSSYSTT